jgi:diadenylate cyclase
LLQADTGKVILDILVVAFIFYRALLLIQGAQAAHLLTGVILACGIYLLSSAIPLVTLNWLLGKFYPSLVVILTIIFQEEIRRALSQMGKKSFLSPHHSRRRDEGVVDIVVRTAFALAEKKIGALMVFQREIGLARYEDLGVSLDALVQKELISAIFQKNSPIHDGAIILSGGRIIAASCLLPLSRRENLSSIYGTRHRAALGLSEETDAVIVVVSEERGTVSLARKGSLWTIDTPEMLRDFLKEDAEPL